VVVAGGLGAFLLLDPSGGRGPEEATFQYPRADPDTVAGYRFCDVSIATPARHGLKVYARTGPTPPDGDVRPVLVLAIDVPTGGAVTTKVPAELRYEIPVGVADDPDTGIGYAVPSLIAIDAMTGVTVDSFYNSREDRDLLEGLLATVRVGDERPATAGAIEEFDCLS
jgi:hypothetical protein